MEAGNNGWSRFAFQPGGFSELLEPDYQRNVAAVACLSSLAL
jgi:hypothetical protein